MDLSKKVTKPDWLVARLILRTQEKSEGSLFASQMSKELEKCPKGASIKIKYK
ncbi:hypothetical protein [Tenacibaculum piscium]|uniref:hypothetical protein n=1 Tax=Tenacibaculum piscium TaxID=1458515 RepID=UPI001F378D61|nr:hypothetical protein [Tenacibaculum piscium]